jgi:hypothetical protein
MICGYCLLPVIRGDRGLVHGDGMPDVGPVSVGDYVTSGHQPGRPVNPADVVEEGTRPVAMA